VDAPFGEIVSHRGETRSYFCIPGIPRGGFWACFCPTITSK